MNGAEALRIARFLFADSGIAAAGVARTGGFGTARFPPRNVPACKPRSRAVSWKSIFC